jgi:hypothetical protein
MDPSDGARFEEVIAESLDLPSPFHERMKELEIVLLQHIHDLVSEACQKNVGELVVNPEDIEHLKHDLYRMIFSNLEGEDEELEIPSFLPQECE